MKKSVEILGLPIISITEGRELGVSKSLIIDAENGMVAALTIDDDEWYRGVKLIPYESIIAIGEDAITITHSENILTLEEAGDYERLLSQNIRVIGTKAITKAGRIQGKVTEVAIGDDGKIRMCEITAPDGTVNEVSDEQISIFGKQVTVVDMATEKKNNLTETPAFEPAFETFQVETPQVETPQVETPQVETPPVETPQVETPQVETPQVETPQVETPQVETPQVETPQVETPQVETPQVETPQVETPQVETPQVETPQVETPSVEAVAPAQEQSAEAKRAEEEQKIASMTQQAEDLKAALQKARAGKKAATPPPTPQLSQKRQVEKAVDERRRRVLLGKHATKTIIAESGTIIVEAGAEVTEDVLQRARLSNKFIELSMNVQ